MEFLHLTIFTLAAKQYYLKADVYVIANKTVAVVRLSLYVDLLKKIFKGAMDFPHISRELAL